MLVAELIDGVTVLLRRDAEVLRPFMLLAATDQQIAIRGRQSAALMTSLFVALLSQRREEIRHPDPVAAIEWCFTIVYSVIARRLGLGSTMEGADDAGDWDELIVEPHRHRHRVSVAGPLTRHDPGPAPDRTSRCPAPQRADGLFVTGAGARKLPWRCSDRMTRPLHPPQCRCDRMQGRNVERRT